MSNSFAGEISKTAVCHQDETNRLRAVLTKQRKAGQLTVDPTEPRKRDGGSCEVITISPSGPEWRGLPDMSSFPSAKSRFLFARLRSWWFCSSLRLLMEECRSLPYRMAWSLEICAAERRGAWDLSRIGFASVSGQQLQSCKDAYIRYMRQIRMDRPWVTICDRLLAEAAWKAGLESGACTGISQSQTQDSSAYPDGGNSMPPLAVRQDSKRDPSVPLPSQG